MGGVKYINKHLNNCTATPFWRLVHKVRKHFKRESKTRNKAISSKNVSGAKKNKNNGSKKNINNGRDRGGKSHLAKRVTNGKNKKQQYTKCIYRPSFFKN